MKITFRAKTNKDYLMVNSAVFKLKCGVCVTVDRDSTYWSITNGVLEMEWYGCYLWEINDIGVFDTPAYLNEFSPKLFVGAKLTGLNLEDDADSDYKITNIRFCIT